MIPIFKKGNKLNPDIYRPISLVSIFSNVLEFCIKEQLYNYYFCWSGLLCKEQFGFLPGLNTIKAVKAVVENISNSVNNRIHSDCKPTLLYGLPKKHKEDKPTKAIRYKTKPIPPQKELTVNTIFKQLEIWPKFE